LPLHQNWRGENGKGVLTGGELGTVENSGVDKGNWCENREELPGSVLQLQSKKEHMRRRPDQATSSAEVSSHRWMADGGGVIRGGGRRSVRSRRNFVHEKLENGGRSSRLADG
jgi:hypothetical protein